MIKYPISFKVKAAAPSGIKTPWRTEAERFLEEPITMAIPPEFEGDGNGLSPEDLYAMALQNCFIATFKVFAEKSNLEYSQVLTEAILDLDRDEKGRPWMARIHMKVTLAGAKQPENAQRILTKTSQSCMILNSVNTVKSFDFLLID